MGDQLVKVEDWLPEGLPEGWKVEIRVRKSGKKDRYYTDPVQGYIFRSLKDIDRYLLTGKLGRHVTKNKQQELDSDHLMIEIPSTPPVVSEKKELVTSDGMKEPCLALAAEGQNSGENASKRKATVTPDSKEAAKKRISRSPAKKSSRSSNKRAPNTPFFILDPDKCEDNDTIDIPNLQEIIDSVRKEKEGHKTVYVSAPTIGSLLGGQPSETRPIQDYGREPRFSLNICQHINISPANLPCVPSQFHVNKQGWGSKNMMSNPYQYASPLAKCNRPMVDTKAKEQPEGSLFGDLFTDPCIDFAVKTLTGSMPTGSDPAVNECLFQQQLGSF